ncbi:MAG: hypothetical protein J2P31_17620 [Blastocatellia bacterium]|nr:hypothetical protein [Blastocatellia bacterium]
MNIFTACSKARNTAEGNFLRGGSGGNGDNLAGTRGTFLFAAAGTALASLVFRFVACLAALVRAEGFLVLAILVTFFFAKVLIALGVAFLALSAFFTIFTDFDFALTFFLTNLFFAGLVLEPETVELVAFTAVLLFDLVL